MTGKAYGFLEKTQTECNGTANAEWDLDISVDAYPYGYCFGIQSYANPADALSMYSVLVKVTNYGNFAFSTWFYSDGHCTHPYPNYNDLGGGCMNVQGFAIGSVKIGPIPSD